MGIITFLKSFFQRKEEEKYELYHPRERLIYSYWNGESEVKVDPMVTYRKLMDKWPELSVDLKGSSIPSKFAAKAHDDAIKNIRVVFSLKPLEEGGLTELETLELLAHFITYSGMLKKNSSLSLTTPEETLVPSVPSSAESPATPNTSDSGSTSVESSTNAQEKLPSGSESLLDSSIPASTTIVP